MWGSIVAALCLLAIAGLGFWGDLVAARNRWDAARFDRAYQEHLEARLPHRVP